MLTLKNIELKINDTTILDDIDFSVAKGEVVAIMGPNGAGKTSILRVIKGLIKPSSGSIIVEDEAKIGFIWQEPVLIDHQNILKNVLLGVKNNKANIAMAKALLTSFNLSKYQNQFPNQLSAGLRQRVGLVQTLMIKPSILLLDEPTANLDAKSLYETLEFLSTYQKSFNLSIILVTHDVNVARFMSDRVIWLDNGKIIKDGKVKKITELKYQNESYWGDLYA